MPDAMKTLYWIRHARPAYPGGMRMCLGRRVDAKLSEEGHAQAERLAEIFAAMKLEAVYSSPLMRAKQTAAHIAALGRPIHILDDLIELDGGEWDGKPFDVLHAQYPDYFVPGATVPPPPGGESDEMGLVRAQAALERIEREVEECAAVVSHSGLSRVLLAALEGIPLNRKKQIHLPYAGISILQLDHGVWRVKEAGIEPETWSSR